MKRKMKKYVVSEIRSNLFDGFRQYLCFPEGLRIAEPNSLPEIAPETDTESPSALEESSGEIEDAIAHDKVAMLKLLARCANCFWYLKTKYFKRDWEDVDNADDNPRARRALDRLNKTIDFMQQNGIEVQDPTGKRYPVGGEGMMRPIQFLPTAGISFEMVTETVAPIIYQDNRMLQRGEVFVAVPKEEPSCQAETPESPNADAAKPDPTPETVTNENNNSDDWDTSATNE